MTLVFAYGSNLCQIDLARWLDEKGLSSRPLHVERATLRGSLLVWNYHSPVRAGGAASIAFAAGEIVPGAVLHVDDEMLAALDRKEGHPARYRRSLELVHVDRVAREAWVYRVTEAHRAETHEIWPTRAYLDVVVRGARALMLPAWHLVVLEATPTQSVSI